MRVFGIKALLIFSLGLLPLNSFAAQAKEPNVAGSFYPRDAQELSQLINKYLDAAAPQDIEGEIFALISPHAGYVYSGQTAAYGYKLIQNRNYKTVVVIGPSHHYGFSGVCVYSEGAFRTPLGDLEVDADFAAKLPTRDGDIVFERGAFEKEHSLEVQLPFLQKTISVFKIVPVLMGDCSLSVCRKLAAALKEAIGARHDVLLVVSTDMDHNDYERVVPTDQFTLSYFKNMDAEGLYYALRQERARLCGGWGVVTAFILAKELGHDKLKILHYTNSAEVTGDKGKKSWAVGYVSCVIDQQKEEVGMLTKEQKKKLLHIARSSLEVYLKTGKRAELKEDDPLLKKEMGTFVTLHQHGDLKGCIGNMVGRQPLYLTIRDMAIAAGTEDYRFNSVKLNELKDVEFEISVLSPMKKVASADEIQLGVHGVMVKKGFSSGVFLPQVATETGWSKEEFLSQLCWQKAGLNPDAWKDSSTELYIFSAEVFSEKDMD